MRASLDAEPVSEIAPEGEAELAAGFGEAEEGVATAALGGRQTIDVGRGDHTELESNRPASGQEKKRPLPRRLLRLR